VVSKHAKLRACARFACFVAMCVCTAACGTGLGGDRAGSATSSTFYLHGDGASQNHMLLRLDNIPPVSGNAKQRDSAGVQFSGGNPWVEIGVWSAAPGLTNATVGNLADLHTWLQLLNSSDSGAKFDLRAEVRKNGAPFAVGESYGISGVTHKPHEGREVVTSFDSGAAVFDHAADELSLRLLARIGTDGHGNFAGGKPSAKGLRVLFDATVERARFSCTQNQGPLAQLAADPLSGSAPLLVQFDAGGSSDPDGSIVQYEWDFDGDAIIDELGPAALTSFTYPSAGTYVATVRVTDNDGQSAVSPPVSIAVSEPPVISSWSSHHGLTGTYTRASNVAGPQTANVAWTFNTGQQMFFGPVLDREGNIYVNTFGDFKVRCLWPNGTLKWSFIASNSMYSCPALSLDDSVVYVSSYDGSLYALDSATGLLLWSYAAGGPLWSGPSIGPDGTIYFGSLDDHLYALNPDGTFKWSYLAGKDVTTFAAVSNDGGTVYFGSADKKVYAVSSATGSLKWSYLTTGNIGEGGISLDTDGTLYVCSHDGVLWALVDNGNTASLKWKYVTGNGPMYSCPAIGPDGTIYVTSMGEGTPTGNVWALAYDGDTSGSLVWQFTPGANVQSTPAVDANGTVYVGSHSKYIYALHADGDTTPAVVWSYFANAFVQSSPAIGNDGSLYIGDNNGRVRKFQP
jgi:outer membrane protein assembly factor BamB